MRIFGRGGDRLMESKIFVNRAFAAGERRVDRRKRAGNAAARSDARPFGGETCRFDLDAGAQLHHLHDLRDRAQAVGIDAERAALDIAHDEGADALAGLDQPLGPQHRNSLAHHRAAHAGRGNQLRLGRQLGARLELASRNLGAQPVDQPLGETARRPERREAQLEERALWTKYENDAMEKAKAAGIQIIEISDKAPFQDAVKPVWDKYGPKYADMIKRIEAVE